MFWDSVAGVYDFFVNVVNRRTHLALRKIVANLIQPSDNELECACGTGAITKHIAEVSRYVVAADLSPKMLKEADLPHYRFHDLRHTYVVTSIHAGDDPKAVSTNAGHYSVAFTLDRYGHFMDSMRKESSERMEQFRMSL